MKAATDSDEMEKLQTGLERIAESDVRIGIAVEELGRYSGGIEAGASEDMVFESASLIKVLVFAEFLARVDEGSVSLEDPLGGSTVGRLAEAMISTSDNAATNLLIDRLDFEARACGEDNFTSASDMIALLSAMWEGDFLSPSSREFALAALENQKLDSKLPASLPPKPVCFTKRANSKTSNTTPESSSSRTDEPSR